MLITVWAVGGSVVELGLRYLRPWVPPLTPTITVIIMKQSHSILRFKEGKKKLIKIYT